MKIRSYKDIMPVLGDNVYVDQTATIIGKVKIGNDSSIWPQTVVRGDVNVISIGQRTNIQDNCVLHVTHASTYNPEGRALLIGDDVTVGHQCVLHACTINQYCLIGIGSIVLDDAFIEPQVMVGAGSLVPSGKRLESGYLYYGRPVKKIRKLTDDELSFLKYSAENYVKLKNDYLSH